MDNWELVSDAKWNPLFAGEWRHVMIIMFMFVAQDPATLMVISDEKSRYLSRWFGITHMLHVWYIYLHWGDFWVHVGKYSIHGASG